MFRRTWATTNWKLGFRFLIPNKTQFYITAGRDRNYLKAFAIYPLNPKWGSATTEINKADLSQNHKRIEVGLDEALGNHLVQPYEYLNTAHLLDLKLLRDKTKWKNPNLKQHLTAGNLTVIIITAHIVKVYLWLQIQEKEGKNDFGKHTSHGTCLTLVRMVLDGIFIHSNAIYMMNFAENFWFCFHFMKFTILG